MNKSQGWMDTPHTNGARQNDHNAHDDPDLRNLHPLISWVQAGNWHHISGTFVPAYGVELLPCPVNAVRIFHSQGARDQQGQNSMKVT